MSSQPQINYTVYHLCMLLHDNKVIEEQQIYVNFAALTYGDEPINVKANNEDNIYRVSQKNLLDLM